MRYRRWISSNLDSPSYIFVFWNHLCSRQFRMDLNRIPIPIPEPHLQNSSSVAWNHFVSLITKSTTLRQDANSPGRFATMQSVKNEDRSSSTSSAQSGQLASLRFRPEKVKTAVGCVCWALWQPAEFKGINVPRNIILLIMYWREFNHLNCRTIICEWMPWSTRHHISGT